MSGHERQVVKLGGSLLSFADWPTRWWLWHTQAACSRIVIVGGGGNVDLLRAEQQARGLSDVDAHWEAIAAMGSNARRGAAELNEKLPPDVRPIGVATHLQQLLTPFDFDQIVLVDPLSILRDEEPQRAGSCLPCSWDVTSDSIAARVAELIDCQQLTLLKSDLPSAPCTYLSAAQQGYVDRHFPIAASGLARVACVNLRSANLASRWLTRN